MSSRIYSKEQKERQRELQRIRRAANPDRFRKLSRVSERKRKLRKYGFTEETYKQKFHDQQGCCAICFTTHPGGKRDWHVDHCHRTGIIRGLLCHHCNLMLGNAKDNTVVLLSAIRYLKKYDKDSFGPSRCTR